MKLLDLLATKPMVWLACALAVASVIKLISVLYATLN